MVAMPARGGDAAYAYVDRERTHEVLALAEPSGDQIVWSVTERPFGSRDPNDLLVVERRVAPALLPQLLQDLETRLAAVGEYYRVDPGTGASSLLEAKAALDLRSHAVAIPDAPDGAYLEYFHFHRERGRSRMLMTMPRDVQKPDGGHFVLAQYEFPTSAPRAGTLSIVHPRLTPPLIVGRVAADHVELPREGFEKLYEPEQYRRALGPDWQETAVRVLESATSLLRIPFRQKAKSIAEVAPAPSEEDVVKTALESPAYRAARQEFLKDPEFVLGDGVLGIQRFMRAARAKAEHGDQVRLSLLEAGLLVEYGQRSGNKRLVDEESPRLVRLSRSLAPPQRL